MKRQAKSEDPLDYLSDGFKSVIRGLFDCMKIAEQEIEHAMDHHEKYEDEINDSFRYMQPTEPLRGKSDELYRLHVREIINRIIGRNQLPINKGTDAELLGAFSEITQSAPIQRDAIAAYNKLFQKRFPNKDVPEMNVMESYEGRSDEIISEMRDKLATQRDCTQ